MPLGDVIAAATSRPAAAIGWGDRIGSLTPGHFADIAILEVSHDPVTITDSYGVAEQVSRNLVARTTIVGGEVLDRSIS